ncbi:hypothetical protein Cme02nite_26030 [Catellatospora methionotrophica]|uniref:Uncharacterized protein n=1 Tax=Catellatospora methionotrophica TaxID=121620 RepID=A0A8J3LFN9_9ACTN|nr:hypothetical protein [Catellatospora methionotrophica]GIG14271.1 hypothetical protein Cme02nite_26030 [Catellatospora methionotrophica]
MADFWSVIDAIGSFGGMCLAGVAGYVAFRLLKVEFERDKKAQEFLYQQQASSIGFWRDGNRHCVVVLNASPLPIYHVVISEYRVGVGGEQENRFSVLMPGQQVEVPLKDIYGFSPPPRKDGTLTHGQYILECGFCDNSRLYWKRDLNGGLRRDH